MSTTGFPPGSFWAIERRHRHVESVWDVSSREFMRLANVDHRPGVGSNRLFQVAKIDNVRIGAGAEA